MLVYIVKSSAVFIQSNTLQVKLNRRAINAWIFSLDSLFSFMTHKHCVISASAEATSFILLWVIICTVLYIIVCDYGGSAV